MITANSNQKIIELERECNMKIEKNKETVKSIQYDQPQQVTTNDS